MGISAAVVLMVVIVALTISNVLIAREQQQTQMAKNELELNLYFNQIALAEREGAVNNMTRVDQLLATCPTVLRGWEWHYLRRLRRGGVSRLPLEGMVFCVGFSPAGELLAAGNNPGMVKIWNTKRGARSELSRSRKEHCLPWPSVPRGGASLPRAGTATDRRSGISIPATCPCCSKIA